MQKIELSEGDAAMLQRFVDVSPEAKIVEKIILYYLLQLDSVRNIDSNGNMGLQTLAAQKAIECLESVFGMMVKELPSKIPRMPEPTKMSPWR